MIESELWIWLFSPLRLVSDSKDATTKTVLSVIKVDVVELLKTTPCIRRRVFALAARFNQNTVYERFFFLLLNLC